MNLDRLFNTNIFWWHEWNKLINWEPWCM